MNKKVIRIAAVISAAALLCGGIYLLVKNDVAQRINWRDIMIYAPTPIARETLDETVDIEKSKPSAVSRPACVIIVISRLHDRIIDICIGNIQPTHRIVMLVGKLTYLFGQFFFGILGNSVGGRLAFFIIDRFVKRFF